MTAERIARAGEFGRASFGEGWTPTLGATANGRIEVIGNHVDYNGGPVVAAAIDRGITVLAGPSSSGEIRATFPDVEENRISTVAIGELGDWRTDEPEGPDAYLRGVVAASVSRGLPVRRSLDLVVHGDIPVGGALSSSAALCVGLAMTLLEEPLGRPELVLLAQEAEHRVGSPVGTMDQSASVFGGVILFGGSPHRVTSLSVELARHRFVVLGSGVQHSNANSKYGERVEECRRALDIFRGRLDREVDELADVTVEELESANTAGAFGSDPILYPRARHIITEVARVRSALLELERQDWETFGTLMTASGRSSATDYDISHPTVERLVAEANDVDGVLGARMMGGGEGGNALALVEEPAIPSLRARLDQTFYRPAGLDVDRMTFVCNVGEAAAILDLEGQ